jgi:hypothetical protein
MVAHTSNPSYWEEEIERIAVEAQPRQKISKYSSQSVSPACGWVHLSSQLGGRQRLEHHLFLEKNETLSEK